MFSSHDSCLNSNELMHVKLMIVMLLLPIIQHVIYRECRMVMCCMMTLIMNMAMIVAMSFIMSVGRSIM